MSNAVCKESWSRPDSSGLIDLAVGLVDSADHVFSRPAQSRVHWYPRSLSSIDPWSLLNQHLGWLSINSWWTFQSTVGQRLTNFCRHATSCRSINLSWLTIDRLLIKCQSKVNTHWLMLAEYQSIGHWDVYQVLIECINQHPTADTSTTYGPILLLHLPFGQMNFLGKVLRKLRCTVLLNNICIPQCKYHYRMLYV